MARPGESVSARDLGDGLWFRSGMPQRPRHVSEPAKQQETASAHAENARAAGTKGPRGDAERAAHLRQACPIGAADQRLFELVQDGAATPALLRLGGWATVSESDYQRPDQVLTQRARHFWVRERVRFRLRDAPRLCVQLQQPAPVTRSKAQDLPEGGRRDLFVCEDPAIDTQRFGRQADCAPGTVS